MTDKIKIMFLGDIVGRPGRCAVNCYINSLKDGDYKKYLQRIYEEYHEAECSKAV